MVSGAVTMSGRIYGLGLLACSLIAAGLVAAQSPSADSNEIGEYGLVCRFEMTKVPFEG